MAFDSKSSRSPWRSTGILPKGWMARISGARSGRSVSTYSIAFSSQTMQAVRVYVDRMEPMISGRAMASLPPASADDLRQPVEGGRPADSVIVARLLAREALLQQHDAGAAGRRLEAHHDLGLVAARAALIFPGPGEGEAARRLDDAIDTARHHDTAVGPPHGDAPAAAGPRIEVVDRGLVAFRRPPPDQLSGLGPEREEKFGRRGYQPFEAQRRLARDIVHDFLRLGICAAASASSRSSAV